MWRQQRSALRKDKSGVTLVELIVTFALIGLFMTAASFVLTSSIRLFTRMQSVSSAVTVSDVLLDKIAGEISAARQPNMNKDDVAFDHGGYYIWMGKDKDSEWITMWNRSGSPMAIYAEPDGALCLKYYETVRGSVGAETTDSTKTVPEMDWHFDKGVYMGYRITKLTFTREEPENYPNVIRIDLEIHNDRTGFTYQTFRYAECYNYKFRQEQVKKYLCVRPEETGIPEDRPPEKAMDFVIKKMDSGEPEEPEEPTEPDDLPDGWVQVTVYHKVIEYDGVHSNEILDKEVIRKKYDPYNRWIEVHPLYGIEGYDYQKGYYQVPVDLSNPRVEYTYYYVPKNNTPYCFVAYDQKTGFAIKKGQVKTGTHGQMVTVSAETIDGYILVSESTITRPLVWTYNHQSNIEGGPNEFKFYYKKQEVPYTIYYKCGDVGLYKEAGTGEYGTTLYISNKKEIEGYVIVDYYKELILNNLNGCEVTFQYKLKLNDSAPFHPVGSDIVIEIEAKNHREPTDMEKRIAQDIFRFFNEGWSNIEVSGTEYLTGAYKIFELDGEKYAVAGGTNRDKFEDSLRAELMKKEGVGEGNIIEIKKDDISSEAKRKVFLEYILKNAGASEEYIKEFHDIDIEFDKDDNPKRLEEVSFKNKQGEEIKIKYR